MHVLLGVAAMAVVGVTVACAEAVSCDDVDCSDGEYCLLFGSDVPYEAGSVSCAAMPVACGAAPDCACLLAEHGGFGDCQAGGDDGFEFIVPGG